VSPTRSRARPARSAQASSPRRAEPLRATLHRSKNRIAVRLVVDKPEGQRAAGDGNAHTSAPVLNDEEQHDIMGVAIPDVQFDPRDSGTWLAALVTIGILALLGAILLSTITLVTRFVRGTWNP
jgi:hypothetical protein